MQINTVRLSPSPIGRQKKLKSTLKAPPSIERTTPSPTFRKPAKHTPPSLKSNSSSVGKSTVGVAGGGRMSSHTKITAPVRVSHSLKERVIHFLALKPQKRDEVLLRVKKGDSIGVLINNILFIDRGYLVSNSSRDSNYVYYVIRDVFMVLLLYWAFCCVCAETRKSDPNLSAMVDAVLGEVGI